MDLACHQMVGKSYGTYDKERKKERIFNYRHKLATK
jgi:hypothetical protein